MALLGTVSVEPRGTDFVAACFMAMASPCELLVRASQLKVARELGECAAEEAWRIEQKFSRYRDDSVTALINTQRGGAIELDEETASLMNFAERCYAISEGMFDITSGILRRAWTFDGSDRLPQAAAIAALLPKPIAARAPKYMTRPNMEPLRISGLPGIMVPNGAGS